MSDCQAVAVSGVRARVMEKLALAAAKGLQNRWVVGGAALVASASAFASGASGLGANTAATFFTGTVVPDVGVIAVALMTLAASIYGIKWLLALVV